MTDDNSNTLTPSSQKSRSRLYGVLILCVILLPMIIAYAMYQTGMGIPTGTTNKGILLQPAADLKELALNEDDSSLKDLFPSAKKRWRILVPVIKNCDRACAQYLYLTRQVHIRLAEKAYRVERILLLLDELSADEMENLKQQHPETLLVTASKTNLEEWLSQSQLPESPEQYFYLVDQEGFAMMRYDISHTGQHLLDDVKKLLKFTYDK